MQLLTKILTARLAIALAILALCATPPLLLDLHLPYVLLTRERRSVSAAALNERNIPHKTFRVQSEPGIDIAGWYLPADNPTGKTAIVLHGLGGIRSDSLAFTLPLLAEGYNLILVDLRNHGESGGEHFTFGDRERQDVAAVLDWLEQTHPEASDEIVAIGYSVGGAVAIAATASDERISRLVTISTFADLPSTIRERSAWLPDFWRNRAIARAETIGQFDIESISPRVQIQEVRVPILVLHGATDYYIHFSNAHTLSTIAAEHATLVYIADANHISMLGRHAEPVSEAIAHFLSR